MYELFGTTIAYVWDIEDHVWDIGYAYVWDIEDHVGDIGYVYVWDIETMSGTLRSEDLDNVRDISLYVKVWDFCYTLKNVWDISTSG